MPPLFQLVFSIFQYMHKILYWCFKCCSDHMGPGKMPRYSNDCLRNKMVFGPDSVWKEAYKRKIGKKKSFLTLWRPHGLQHTRLLYPSQSPRACSNSCPLSRWCHSTISSSVIPFSSCLQSFLTSGSFPMSWLFLSGGQSIGASASASVLPMYIQGWPKQGYFHTAPKETPIFSKVRILEKNLPNAAVSWCTPWNILPIRTLMRINELFFLPLSSIHNTMVILEGRRCLDVGLDAVQVPGEGGRLCTHISMRLIATWRLSPWLEYEHCIPGRAAAECKAAKEVMQ